MVYDVSFLEKSFQEIHIFLEGRDICIFKIKKSREVG